VEFIEGDLRESGIGGIRVIHAVHEILRYMGHTAETNVDPQMPTGPLNQVRKTR
jgi:hypothetical protein